MVRAALFLVGAAVTWAQAPTIEQSVAIKSAGAPQIADDGRYVAWTVNEADLEENEYKTQIWVWSRATGQAVQVTRGKKSAAHPRFSPDGRRLAFLSARDGKTQVYVLSLAGGEAVQLTKDEAGVEGFEWAPDGRRVAFTSPGAEPKAAQERKEKYGEYEVVREEYRYSHLWLAEAPAEIGKPVEAAPLTTGERYTVGGFAWAPDGRRIAFSAAQNPDLTMAHSAELYVLEVASKLVTKIVEREGSETNPVWSPDGKEIAFSYSEWNPLDCCPNSKLGVVAAAGGEIRRLAEELDENPSLDAWTPHGIYISALEKTAAAEYHVDPQTGKLDRLPPMNSMPVAYTRDGRTAAWLEGSAEKLPEIYISGLYPFQPRAITALSGQISGMRLAKRELARWKSRDGAEIEGVLIKPADFEASKKYPLLVVIHGGPTGIDRPVLAADRYYPLEQFVAKGAVVLRPNYRGSAGYGEKFRSLNVRNLGVGDAWDVLSGVERLAAQGWVDTARMGAMGWSQGGYISAFLTTTTDRFKAVSVGAGISDWMTYYVNTDITTFTRRYLKATPWDDPEVYRKTSPISYVKGARTPTLIQHGENDRRVPIPNAYELRQALEDRSVPVRMVVYKGFGHGITKPKQMRHVMEDNLRWFARYLWGE